MKKLFPGILALLMAFSCFVGCGETAPDTSTPAGSTPPASTPGDSTPDDSTPDEEDPLYALNAVKEVLNGAMIKKNVEMRKDYTVANQWYSWHADETFEITWTVTDAEGNATTNVSIEEGDGENDTVKVNSNLEEDFTYILKGTITDSKGQSVEISFTRKVLKAGEYLPVKITAKPVEDVVYKLYVYQSTLAKDMFFNGDDTAATYYFGTTEDYMEAVDVGVEYIENSDAFNVFFTDANGAKKYIGVQLSEDGAHDNIKATDAPVSSFVWSDEYQTILTHLDVNKNGEASDYYLGNYGTKDTISCSMISYAGGAGNNVGGLVTMVHKDDIKVPDADKVAAVKDSLSVQLNHTLDKELTLKIADDRYSDVSISWSVEADKGATVANDKLNLVIPAEKTTVVLTATVACGDVTETKTFELELGPKTVVTDSTDPASILAAAFNLAPGEALEGKYTLTGEIKTIKTAYSEEYKNITVIITIGDKEMECYRLKGSDTTDASALKVGDTITVSGTIKNYNGKVEFDAGCTLDAVVAGGEEGGETPDTPDEPEVPEYAPMTITEALAAPEGTKVEISGTVNKLYEEWSSYNNMSPYITDGTVEILVFRTTTKVSIGDVITVKGVITVYNDVNQIAKEGSIVEITQAHTCTDFNEATCQSPATCTVCGAAQTGSAVVDHVYENGACKWCSAPEGVETLTASVSIPDYAAANSWVNQTKYTSIDLDDNVTVTVAGGNNSGKYYTSGNAWRIYASDSPAGSLTISVGEGFELVSIKVTTDTGTYAYLCVDGTTDDISNETVAVSGSSVLLNTVKNGSDGKQVRVKAIEVVYKAV